MTIKTVMTASTPIKAGTVGIAGGVFANKPNLTKVDVPESVNYISESVFENSTTFDDTVFRNLGLDFQGALTTQRVIWLKTESLTVVLDHNLYLGHSDYELEVEYAIGCEAEADAFIKGLAKILHTFGVCDNPDEFCLRSLFQKSKSNRFFQRKQLFPLDQPIMNNREQGSHESF